MKFCFRMFSCTFQAGVHPCIAMPPTLLVVVMALAMVGCSKADRRVAVYPAEGRVTWKGKPLAGAQLAFYRRHRRFPEQRSDFAQLWRRTFWSYAPAPARIVQ